jgi:hypothetical protein
MDATVFRAIADQGLAIVAVVALSLALWWLIRTHLESLRSDRDYWRTIASGAIEALDRLADELAKRPRSR